MEWSRYYSAVVLVTALVVGAAVYCFVVPGVEGAPNRLTFVGLIFDAAGAFLVLVSDLDFLRKRVVPDERINSIERGRKHVFSDRIIKRGDDGFEELAPVIADYFNSDEPDVIYFFHGGGSARNAITATSLGAWKSMRSFEESDLPTESTRKHLKSADDWSRLQDDREGESVICPTPVFNARLNRQIEKIENAAVQTPLRLGLLSLLLGFSLQIVSSGWTIFL